MCYFSFPPAYKHFASMTVMVLMQLFSCNHRALETLHTIFSWMYLYELIVTRFGNLIALVTIYWHFAGTLCVFGLLGAIVQSYNTYRVYIVSGRNLWITVPAWALIGANLSATIAITYYGYVDHYVSVFQTKHGHMAYAVLIMCVIVRTIRFRYKCRR
jgi:hypothetical protein